MLLISQPFKNKPLAIFFDLIQVGGVLQVLRICIRLLQLNCLPVPPQPASSSVDFKVLLGLGVSNSPEALLAQLVYTCAVWSTTVMKGGCDDWSTTITN